MEHLNETYLKDTIMFVCYVIVKNRKKAVTAYS